MFKNKDKKSDSIKISNTISYTILCLSIIIGMVFFVNNLVNADVEVSASCVLELEGDLNLKNYNITKTSYNNDITFENLNLQKIKLNDCKFNFKGNSFYLMFLVNN